MRRSNDALYFTDDIVVKLKNKGYLDLEDFVNMFFPSETNQKQYKCTLTFMQTLQKQGIVQNTQLKQLFPTNNDRTMFLSHILPKLQKFDIVKSTADKNTKKYELTMSDFYYILEHTILSWIRQKNAGTRT